MFYVLINLLTFSVADRASSMSELYAARYMKPNQMDYYIMSESRWNRLRVPFPNAAHIVERSFRSIHIPASKLDGAEYHSLRSGLTYEFSGSAGAWYEQDPCRHGCADPAMHAEGGHDY